MGVNVNNCVLGCFCITIDEVCMKNAKQKSIMSQSCIYLTVLKSNFSYALSKAPKHLSDWYARFVLEYTVYNF